MDYVVTADGMLKAKLTRQGKGWVGMAVPSDPNCQICMSGSDAIIGVPGENASVLKYDLNAYKLADVIPMEDTRQTLMDTSIAEVDGTTVVTFTKLLVEEGENPIDGNGPNTFLYAMGPEGGTELAYHTLKGKYQLDLSPCRDISETEMPVPSPTADTDGNMPAPTASGGEDTKPTVAPPTQPSGDSTSAAFECKFVSGLVVVMATLVPAFLVL